MRRMTGVLCCAMVSVPAGERTMTTRPSPLPRSSAAAVSTLRPRWRSWDSTLWSSYAQAEAFSRSGVPGRAAAAPAVMEQLGRLIDTSIASRDPDDFLDGLDDVRSAAEPLEIERSRTAKTRNSYNVLNSSFSRSASSFGTVGSGEALRESLPQLGIRDFGLCVCACCKKIRDDKGYWNQVAAYIPAHSEVEFSHSLCPECLQNLYPNLKREEMSPYQQAGDQLRALKPL